MEQEWERAAVEVARIAWGFLRTPESRDRLLRQVKEITAGLDPAAVMIALGALLRRGIDRALDEGREDEAGFKESERFLEDGLAGRSAGQTGLSAPDPSSAGRVASRVAVYPRPGESITVYSSAWPARIDGLRHE